MRRSAILAALQHRDKTGEGQHIDLALLDAQVAWLANVGMNYLTSAQVPKRARQRTSEHRALQDVLPSSDGYIILAVGNDAQFQKFCEFAGRAGPGAADPRFATNEAAREAPARAVRADAGPTRAKNASEWVDGLATLGVPCSPVNTVDQVFADPQVQHREMQIAMRTRCGGRKGAADRQSIKHSETPVDYRRPPPYCGQHTDEVLKAAAGDASCGDRGVAGSAGSFRTATNASHGTAGDAGSGDRYESVSTIPREVSVRLPELSIGIL